MNEFTKFFILLSKVTAILCEGIPDGTQSMLSNYIVLYLMLRSIDLLRIKKNLLQNTEFVYVEYPGCNRKGQLLRQFISVKLQNLLCSCVRDLTKYEILHA
jgi:hypothetical protein